MAKSLDTLYLVALQEQSEFKKDIAQKGRWRIIKFGVHF